MAVRFIGVTTAAAVGTSITVTVPARADLKSGDVLFAFFTVQAYAGATFTAPSGWVFELAVPTVGDQAVFTALRYVVDDEPEPASYVFAYGASKPMVAIVGVYRAVQQDVAFDTVNYPFGYYAPAGSAGTAEVHAAVSSIVTPATGSSALVPWGRGLFHFGGTHASAIPQLSDPSPLIAMRAKIETAKVSAMLCDTVERVVTNPLPAYASASSVTLSGAIGYARVLEPLVSANDSLDTYKAKILRRLMPPPYGPVAFDEPLGVLLNSIGLVDNDIGGLHGDFDFLPDES